MTRDSLPPGSIVLSPEQGRTYDMGFMRAVFKADGAETDDRYSVSEWWMEPRNAGPGAHHHEDNDEVFYVLEGTASILIGREWVDVGKGSFIRIPAGATHDFENRTDARMGLLNFFIPGGFEKKMPAIVDWFQQNRQATAIDDRMDSNASG
jgi:mannose-6-phosphate isomerase-like protein (cupin superfamily)